MKKQNNKYRELLLFALIAIVYFFINNPLNHSTDYEYGKVVYVVDGDTADVLIDNKKYRVRFIGMDTPEYNPRRNISDYYGKEAFEYSKQTLKNKHVYLEKDVSETDKYGRLLRYVWLELPKDSKKPTSDEIENQMFNAILVRDGYARVKVYKPDVKYTKSLKDIEEDAKNNKVGLWK